MATEYLWTVTLPATIYVNAIPGGGNSRNVTDNEEQNAALLESVLRTMTPTPPEPGTGGVIHLTHYATTTWNGSPRPGGDILTWTAETDGESIAQSYPLDTLVPEAQNAVALLDASTAPG